MQSDVSEQWREQYSSFFEGLTLSAVEEINWPVHRLTLTAHLRQSAELDALEEGLLRLVDAGIDSPDDLSTLLGCSSAYVETMGRYLQTGVTPYVSVADGKWTPTSATKTSIAARERIILVSEERDLLRDGLFGFWLTHGDTRFRVTEAPNSERSPSRWLGTLVNPEIATEDLQDTCQRALDTFGPDVEIHSYDEPQSLGLAWVLVRLLYFQSEDRKTGRVLLVNPESENQPLDDLSYQFEQMLRNRSVPLYFPDDALGTASAFWDSLKQPMVGYSVRENLALVENDLKETRQELDVLMVGRGKSEQSALAEKLFRENLALEQRISSGEALIAVDDAVTALLNWLNCRLPSPTNVKTQSGLLNYLRDGKALAKDQHERLQHIVLTLEQNIDKAANDAERKQTADRLGALLALMANELGLGHTEEGEATKDTERIKRYEEAIAERDAVHQQLLDRIAEMPTSELIESKEHPPLLARALKEADKSLIVISPWIKMRVLRPLLPAIDGLLARGCEIWIGYGMPKSRHHQDTSDPDAIASLRERERAGLLHLVQLTTHEKVLILDDRLFVSSSFNWLSYTGGDGRRETGTVLRGRVSHMRDRFLKDMKNIASTPDRGSGLG